ncbi:MAG TPA: FecR family protein [Hanamia sp.]|nr:FecR family protein [Hanamia sp.]
MDKKLLVDYRVEDFISEESFINYHFNLDKDDRVFWEEWLSSHPEKKDLINEAAKIIDQLSLRISEKEFQEELNKIRIAVHKQDAKSRLFQLSSGGNFFQWYQRKKRKIRIVFPAIILIAAFGYWIYHSTLKTVEKIAVTTNHTGVPIVFTLSDSTVVTLLPNSSLRYPASFNNVDVRNVYLSGNARFHVKRDVHHPFKVHSENIIATVLGTIFNIKKSGDSAIVVELLKGKLNVQVMNSKMQPEQSVLLFPNERAVYVRSDKHLYKNLIVVSDHDLYFKKSNFSEIARQIEEAYGISLINNSHRKDWQFTGEFKNSSALEIVKNMCLIENLSFKVIGDTIIIK